MAYNPETDGERRQAVNAETRKKLDVLARVAKDAAKKALAERDAEEAEERRQGRREKRDGTSRSSVSSWPF